VEDDENDAVLFERTLSKVAGTSTLHHCSDTEAAKRYLLGEEHFSDRKRFPFPQAILCDLRVGLESGLDLLKWMRTHALLFAVPLIIFSGDLSDHELAQVYEAGANSVVIKPASLGEFEQRIKAITDFWSLAQKPSSVFPQS
jgi:DNA-binding response OmpR family regulator